MKKLVFIVMLLLFNLNTLTAQHYKSHENFKAHKVAYITQQLDLSPKEAEEFWPIYNAYEKNVYKLKVLNRKEIKKQIAERGGMDSISDQEANQYVQKLIKSEEDFISLKKEFYIDLKNVLSSKKTLKLYNTENEFNRRVLSEFRKKKHKQMK